MCTQVLKLQMPCALALQLIASTNTHTNNNTTWDRENVMARRKMLSPICELIFPVFYSHYIANFMHLVIGFAQASWLICVISYCKMISESIWLIGIHHQMPWDGYSLHPRDQEGKKLLSKQKFDTKHVIRVFDLVRPEKKSPESMQFRCDSHHVMYRNECMVCVFDHVCVKYLRQTSFHGGNFQFTLFELSATFGKC